MDESKKAVLMAVKEAGELLLNEFGKGQNYSFKEDFSPSIKEDSQVENIIISSIEKNFPGHSILAEESGLHGDENAEFLWVIDPIDGTANFVRGVPIFGISVGLLQNKKMHFAIGLLPTKNEFYWAEEGKGAYLNDEKLQVSSKDKLKEALVLVESGRSDKNREILVEILSAVSPKTATFRKLGSSIYDLSLIARGEADIYIDIGDPLYDQAAGLLIAQEAGSKLSTFSGEEWSTTSTDTLIVSESLHSQVVEILKTVKI